MSQQNPARSGATGPPVEGVKIALQPRISLDEIRSDWLTVRELSAWTGLSLNATYEICRQDPLSGHVVRFGRQIRIPKKVLEELLGGAS